MKPSFWRDLFTVLGALFLLVVAPRCLAERMLRGHPEYPAPRPDEEAK